MKRFMDRILDRVALRIADKVANRLVSMSESFGLTQLILNTTFGSLPKDITPYKLFAGLNDETWFWLNTEGFRNIPSLRDILPGVPDEKYQKWFAGSTGDTTLRQGLEVSQVFKQIYEKHVGDFSACKNVLDFGCGWGRVMRFYLRDIEANRLWGIDTSDPAIEFCKQTNKWCNFLKNDQIPPTSFQDNMFDLVFAYSVFSHLSEERHKMWLEELHRVLKPGGLLIVTTWGRDMITRCRDFRNATDLPAYQAHLPGLFPDTEQSLASYENGKFCFDTSAEMYGPTSKWFGEACIPKGYVLEQWTKNFKFTDYIYDEKVCRQNIIVVMK